MQSVDLNGRTIRLSAEKLVGKGGEADIYRIDPRTVLKLYKRPDDPDYAGNQEAQQGARERLKEIQRKLPVFPKLNADVVAPIELARSQGEITGFTMPFVDQMDVLLTLADRQYREQNGIDGNRVLDTFRQLRTIVRSIHGCGVVIGDFNDLNVLFNDSSLKIVDADSMSFGGFNCHTFTSRFVDPLNCDRTRLVLTRPHTADSDWYAFFVMLIQSLLFVGPYGGVHRPKIGKRLQHDDRVLSRITMLDPDVIYPKPALPVSILPDELMDEFERVFKRDGRGECAERLLASMRFTTCIKCGLIHARAICPSCSTGTKPVTVARTVRGTVTATRVLFTEGRVLAAAYQDGELRYLYHQNGAFYRETGELLRGDLQYGLRFKLQGDATLIGSDRSVFSLGPSGQERFTTDSYQGRLPLFDANARHSYWLNGEHLVRNGNLGPQTVGWIVPTQTLFWVGERIGFGFYTAGKLVRGFVFDALGHGFNDQAELPAMPGQLVDASCAFSHDRIWFMATLQDAGNLVNRCFVFDVSGSLLAETTAASGEDSWLGHGIRGHLAVHHSLLVSTDDGIVRLYTDGGWIVTERTFPDTEPFVTAETSLIAGKDGIYAVSNHEIVLLKIA